MAQNRSPAFFAVALLFLAAAAPLGLAQVPPAQLLPLGGVLNAIQINGLLCPGGSGLTGVNYTMICRIGTLGSGSGSLVVSQGFTGINNAGFTIILGNVPALLSSLRLTVSDVLNGNLPCQIIVDLPVNQLLCPTVGVVNGVLTGVLSLVGTTVSSLLGLVVTFAVNLTVGVSL